MYTVQNEVSVNEDWLTSQMEKRGINQTSWVNIQIIFWDSREKTASHILVSRKANENLTHEKWSNLVPLSSNLMTCEKYSIKFIYLLIHS